MIKAIGFILKQERERRGYYQSKVAEDIGITRAHLSNIENGKNEAYGIKLLIKLSFYYNTKLSKIIERAEFIIEN